MTDNPRNVKPQQNRENNKISTSAIWTNNHKDTFLLQLCKNLHRDAKKLSIDTTQKTIGYITAVSIEGLMEKYKKKDLKYSVSVALCVILKGCVGGEGLTESYVFTCL